MAGHEEMSTSFGAVAGVYETGRPDYPAAAVEWMLEPVLARGERPRVADVGAGTGKLTRVVVATGADVVAVDPDPAMLAELSIQLPSVPTIGGVAEALPFPEASLDAVVLGQAWHWVDPHAGSTEIGRVVRPGGVLGLIWNVRDHASPWVVRLTEIMHGSKAEQMIADDDVRVFAPFGEPEIRDWRWERPMTRATLFAMVRSRSYIITASPEERRRIDADLDVLFDDIGAVGEASVALPYVTRVFRSVRNGGQAVGRVTGAN